MYKQCIELLTAQGTNTQKTFSVVQGSHQGDIKKNFDGSIKGNVYYMEGHKIIMPAINNSESNSGGGGGQKAIQSMSSTGKLDIIHRYLVVQMYLASGDPFSCELHIKDKNNNRRRLMFVEGSKDIVCNSMHARIPNGLIKRNIWLNLCIDIQSFVNECFGGSKQSQQNTPQVSNYNNNGLSSHGHSPNFYKCLEQIQIEGHLRIRKVFSSRSQIPCEFGDLNNQQIITGSGAVYELAEVEFLPKNLDFNPSVNSLNQVLNYDQVQQYLILNQQNGVEDSIMITGLQIQNKTSSNLKDKKQVISTQSKKKMSQDSTNMKKLQNQQCDDRSAQEVQGLSTGSSFRPNKFGLNNKTQDSFQKQKSNASTANQTAQSNTVYSIRTNSSKKQFGGLSLSHQNSGIQSSQSPFQKGSILQKKQSNNQVDDIYEDGPQVQRVSIGANNKNQAGLSQKDKNAQSQSRALYNSQNRKSPGPDQMLGNSNGQQHRYSTKSNGINNHNNTRNTKQALNLTSQTSANLHQSNLMTINSGTMNQQQSIMTPKQEYNNSSAQNTFIGFQNQQIHQTTIVEENETVAPSERVSQAVNEYHIQQLTLQKSAKNEDNNNSKNDGNKSKNAAQSDSESRFNTKNSQKSKQSTFKNKSQVRGAGASNKDNAYGMSSLGMEKQKTENTNAYSNNIEDSIGIIGNSINKTSKIQSKNGANPTNTTNNRNQNQQQKRISQSNINSAHKTKQHNARTNQDHSNNNRQQQYGATGTNIVRKFSTGDEYNEEEAFKNKTLRFTNNNFVAVNKEKRENNGLQTTVNGWHHNKDPNSLLDNNAGLQAQNITNNGNYGTNTQMQNSEDEESIEEEIMTHSLNDTPVLGCGGNKKNHSKHTNLHMNMPPLAPKLKNHDSNKFSPLRKKRQTSNDFSNNNLDTSTNNNNSFNNQNVVEDQIEEDIKLYNDTQDDGADDNDNDYELYQAPISGGVPIRLIYQIDNSTSQKRPFTPPFQQIVKMQQLGGYNSKMSTQRKDEQLQQQYVIKNPIEEEVDQEFNMMPGATQINHNVINSSPNSYNKTTNKDSNSSHQQNNSSHKDINNIGDGEDPMLKDSLDRASSLGINTPILTKPQNIKHTDLATANNLTLQNQSSTNSSNTNNKKKQLVYDTQLKCYYDPETNEYFELRNSFNMH